MLKTIDFVIIALMAAAAVITFQIKFQTDKQLEEVRRLEAQIRLEEDTIDLLNADWSLLVQPARLQELVKLHADELGLEITESHQIVRPQELPARVIDLPDPDPDRERIVEAVDDKTLTGSVGR